MKVVYFPHKGQNRLGEGGKWKNGLHWGADFMLDAFQRFAPEKIEIIPCYNLNWDNVKDSSQELTLISSAHLFNPLVHHSLSDGVGTSERR